MKAFSSDKIKNFVFKPIFNENVILNRDSSWPRITIVTPSYNQVQFLERTILSVLNQNYPNLEYIIIDGGSNDGSIEVIKKYEKYLAYWVSEKDNGQSDAINKGFQKSTGEILAWLNSDDTYLPGAFFEVVNVFKKKPHIDLVFGNIYFINEYDCKIAELRLTKLNILHFIYGDISFAQQAVFWTKEIYDRLGGLNPHYHFCMDLDFFIRIVDIGHLVHIRKYLANFRIQKDSKTSTELDIWREERNEIIKQYMSENTTKAFIFHKKNICRTQRILYHLAQGDIIYILKKCTNRLRGVTFHEELKL